MPIEFPCSSCQKTLRVPDDAAGKHAKCPSCGAIQVVPGALAAGPPLGQSPPWSFDPPPGGPPEKANPFGAGAAVNPYAPPVPLGYEPKPGAPFGGPITNQRPALEEIMGHAWEVWKANLGLLVGVTFVVIAISWAIGIPLGIVQGALEAKGEKAAAAVIYGVGNIVAQLVQIYLGIGQAQIALKLARGQPAEFTDLFGGGPRFLWVFLVSLLFGAALLAGMLACIIPGIIVAMILWPMYWLVLDDRAGVLESFSVAHHITQGNLGTILVLGWSPLVSTSSGSWRCALEFCLRCLWST